MRTTNLIADTTADNILDSMWQAVGWSAYSLILFAGFACFICTSLVTAILLILFPIQATWLTIFLASLAVVGYLAACGTAINSFMWTVFSTCNNNQDIYVCVIAGRKYTYNNVRFVFSAGLLLLLTIIFLVAILILITSINVTYVYIGLFTTVYGDIALIVYNIGELFLRCGFESLTAEGPFDFNNAR